MAFSQKDTILEGILKMIFIVQFNYFVEIIVYVENYICNTFTYSTS